MAKSRVATRVKAAVGGAKTLNQNQDLVKLRENYVVFVKRLQGLIAALKQHFANMNGIAKSRHLVAQHLAVLSKETPLFDKTGQLPDAENSSATVLSYLSIQRGVAEKAQMYGQKYSQFVVDYAVEWEKVVTSRVNKGLKTAEQLQVELDHYQRKVESLRQSANATMAKGKQVDQKTADRLTRNEEKLVKCRTTYGEFVASLCTLIDEVTDRSWRDLHPLLVKIAQFEVTLSGDEAKALSSLNNIVNELKRLAITHGIKPQARLKDLDTMDPSTLSTRKPGTNTLSIEAGMGGLSMSNTNDIWSPGGSGMASTNDSDQHLPPGSFATSGMGGFPVSVHSSSDNYSVGASTTGGTAPSTLDMMSINASAAPAPTLDGLTAAFGPSPTSAGGAGAIVPSPTSAAAYAYGGRKQSYDSFDSAFSGFSGQSAPPPAAPPPPPPSQFGTEGAANSNPFGPTTSYGAPPPAYGAPSPFGNSPVSQAPSPHYGQSSTSQYGQPPQYQQQQQQNFGYGQPPPQYGQPQQSMYGQSQPSPSYGQPPANPNTNPFG